MQIAAVTMENSMGIPQKTKNGTTMWCRASQVEPVINNGLPTQET